MFSIVIPLFNKEDSIQVTLKSVIAQTNGDFEVIVVDDGSTDNSVAMVGEIGDSRIKLIKKPNEGVSATRNTGIELARYEYIALLDADDIWEPDYLAEQKKMIKEFPDAALWSCAYGYLTGEKKVEVDHLLPDGFRNYVKDYFDMKRATDLFCSSSVVIRKNAFKKAGKFDPRIGYAEDLDMWYRLILAFPVAFYNKTLAYYQQESENRALYKRIPLTQYLPYYIDKFKKNNSTANNAFLAFINNWAAVKLLYYYFDTKGERKEAVMAIKNLDFSKIHKKYTFLYKTPFLMGYTFYKFVLLKKWLWKSISL